MRPSRGETAHKGGSRAHNEISGVQWGRMCARGRKARWAAACRHLPALVVGYGMGHASFGDFRLPLVWWVAAALVAMVTAGAIVGGVGASGVPPCRPKGGVICIHSV